MIPPIDLAKYASATSIVPPVGEAEVRAFVSWDSKYILPDGRLSALWEREKIVRVPVPEMRYIIDGVPITKVAVHRRIEQPTRDVFRVLGAQGLIEVLQPYAGGYVNRLVRGGFRLSAHAYGIGLDFDPKRNPYRSDPERSNLWMDPKGRKAIDILSEFGWWWGGRFKNNPDPMHFSFVNGGM